MPEATKDNPESLKARADALVADGPLIDPESLAAEAVDRLIAEPPFAPLAPAVAAETVSSPDLASAVEKLISPADQAPQKIESLDAQIATMADDLLAGELRDEQDQLRGQLGAAPPEVATPAPAAPAAPAAAPAPPEPPRASEAPVFDMPMAPRPAAPLPPPARPAPPAKKAPASKAAQRTAQAAANLKPVGLGLLSVLSGPLKRKPKYVRDTVGWIALWTLFNATCVWGYVLFLRSPTPSAPSKIVESDSHGETKAKEGASHGAADKPADKKKTPTKKAEKKPPAKKDAKAQAAHGGGH